MIFIDFIKKLYYNIYRKLRKEKNKMFDDFDLFETCEEYYNDTYELEVRNETK